MRLIAKKPCSYGGRQFFIGEQIPEELVADVKREEQYGVLSIDPTDGGVSGEVGTLFTKEQVDQMIAEAAANAGKDIGAGSTVFYVTVRGEGENVTAIPCSAEDIQVAVDVLQMNADDGAKAITEVRSESVLILVHALDPRSTIKKAAQKQHDILEGADT